MKIGLLSMQRVINYGSFLQSYALKKILESLGHEVNFVDIIPGDTIEFDIKETTAKKPKIDKAILKRIEHVVFSKIRKKHFLKKIQPSIGIDRPVAMEECDIIVIGSDEVFNCLQSKIGFSTQLLGNTGRKTISYAASCGYTTFEAVRELELDKKVKECVDNFSAISVRDRNTFDFIYKLTGKEAYLHLDPVLVYDWNLIVKNKTRFKNYILIYAYDNRINDPKEIETIRQFARKNNELLISFGVYQRWCDKNVLCNPIELISYFDGADYVITDTFHGTVISIKRNKKFVSIVRKSNENKLSDLLNKFNLTNREISNIENLEQVISSTIDYEQVNRIIDSSKQNTVKYLKESII